MTKRIIRVTITPREDGGIRVHSDDLPGLILSGKNKPAIIADIEPAAKAILEHKGDSADIRIDATFISR